MGSVRIIETYGACETLNSGIY